MNIQHKNTNIQYKSTGLRMNDVDITVANENTYIDEKDIYDNNRQSHDTKKNKLAKQPNKYDKKINPDQIKITNENFKKYEYLLITKINDYIYLGSYEHPFTNSNYFQKLNIDIIINCAKEISYDADKLTVHFEIIDGDDLSMLDNMDNAVETINKYVSEGKKIYIHCAQGISRSPAILIYYLMVYCNYSYYDAHDFIKSKRSVVEIDTVFDNQLRVIEDI